MKKADFSRLEPFFDKIAKLSKVQRILLSAGTFLVIIAVFFYFALLPKQQEISKLDDNIDRIEKKLRVAKRNAKDLKKFQKKMKEAEIQFKLVMKSLPEKGEIPALLASVSTSGRDAGLDFLLFQPRRENPKNFYAEIPVSIRVNGSYHDTAQFFDKVARLARIVNIRNVAIKPTNKGSDLVTSCTAVTYKFMEPKKENNKKKKKNRRSKRKKKKKK